MRLFIIVFILAAEFLLVLCNREYRTDLDTDPFKTIMTLLIIFIISYLLICYILSISILPGPRCLECGREATTPYCIDCGMLVITDIKYCPECKVKCQSDYCGICGKKVTK